MLYPEEMIKLLKTNPDSILEMSEAELEEKFGKEIADLKDAPQNNPHHSYDILTHSVECVKAMRKIWVDDEYLYIAALYHDVAKPACRGINQKTGYDTFYNHESVSASWFKQIFLNQIEYAKLNKLAFAIEHHDICMHLTLDHARVNKWNIYCDNKGLRIRCKEYGMSPKSTLAWDLIDWAVQLAEDDTMAQSNFMHDQKLAIIEAAKDAIDYNYDCVIDDDYDY